MLAALLALALVPVPAVNVNFEPCPGYDRLGVAGCYIAETNTAYVPQRDDNDTLWHEVGHAFDARHLDDGERDAFMCLPAMWLDPGLYERRCGGTWDEEAFADAYANCALGYTPANRRFMNGFGYEPTTVRRHRNACRFIKRAAD